MKNITQKEEIISEYLSGISTYRRLAEKYGISPGTSHKWVKESEAMALKKVIKTNLSDLTGEEPVPTDIKQLQAELHKARLHNKLLNAMIDIAEEQLKIDIRKKSGTRQ